MGWLARATGLKQLDDTTRAALNALPAATLPRGHVLFCPGDAALGFAIMLRGRVEVYLTGPTGREILLYAIEPGESCVQSTLGLLGGSAYSGEAVTTTESELIFVPRDLFLRLMDTSHGFRQFVFHAFADRMQDMMTLLERVAFQKVESRLAAVLLDRAKPDVVLATHHDLAVAIGSAREVVSRRLDALARRGLVRLDRGNITLLDRAALAVLAAVDAPGVT